MSKQNTSRRISSAARMENVESRQYMAFTPSTPGSADLRTAVPLGTAVTTAISRSDSVGNIDRQDFFSFRVSTRGTINVKLDGLSADADLTVFNSSRARIGSSSKNGRAADAVSLTLSPGTYYARVHSYDLRATSYRLSVQRGGSSPSNPIRGSDTFTHNGDWYYQEFTISGATTRVRLDFNSTWAADAMIVDSAADVTSFTNNQTTYGYAVFDDQTGYDYATLAPGRYWVVVRSQSSGNNSMNFTLTQLS